jgi:hypothetical protein
MGPGGGKDIESIRLGSGATSFSDAGGDTA